LHHTQYNSFLNFNDFKLNYQSCACIEFLCRIYNGTFVSLIGQALIPV